MGKTGIEIMIDRISKFCNDVFEEAVTVKNWMRTVIYPLNKGKKKIGNCWNYRKLVY